MGAEILFNIGHTNKLETFPGEQDNVIMIDAFDDVPFDIVIPKALEILKGKTISLITDSQHLHQVEPVRKKLENGGVFVKIGKGKGQLNDGQVLALTEGPWKGCFVALPNNRVRVTSPAMWVTGNGPPDFIPSQWTNKAEAHDSYMDWEYTFNNLYAPEKKK